MKRTGYLIAFSLLVVLQSTAAILPALADDKDTAATSNSSSDSSDSKDTTDQDAKTAEQNTIAEIGAALSLKLKELENHFFGHLYITESVSHRIVRLERFVFGTESGGPFSTRIEHVASSLNVTDPDGSKRSINIEPKAPPPPTAAAAPPANTSTDNKAGMEEESQTTADEKNSAASSDLQALAAAGNAKANAPGVPTSVSTPPTERPATQMEVSPVVNSKDRKIATISTTVMPDRPGGGLTLQVTKDYFSTSGKPAEIIKELDQAIRVHPNDPELMFERGKAYLQLEKFTNAVTDLSDAILGQPNKSAYYIARAWCYKKLGNSYLAADDVKQAHFVDPALPPQVDLVINTK
ncbi:MAG TPA: hypothetical protein V6C97_35790 [Oculatellaceae cyanobacterium]